MYMLLPNRKRHVPRCNWVYFKILITAAEFVHPQTLGTSLSKSYVGSHMNYYHAQDFRTADRESFFSLLLFL